MLSFSVSEVKKQLFSLISSSETTIVNKNNQPVAVIVPYEEYEELFKIRQEKRYLEAMKRVEQGFSGEDRIYSSSEIKELRTSEGEWKDESIITKT